MRPKKPETTGEGDLFRARLDQIINLSRAGAARCQARLGLDRSRDRTALQRQGPARHRDPLRDRAIATEAHLRPVRRGCLRALGLRPYFQHFTGFEFFQHEFPHERSDLSHWRKRLGDKLELVLAESLRVAHEAGALRTRDLKRVTVDTTVQPKAITFPTDAKLLHAAIRGLCRLAKKHGVRKLG